MVDKLTEVKFTVIGDYGEKFEEKMKVEKGFKFNFKDELGKYYGCQVNDNGQLVVIDGNKKGSIIANNEISAEQFYAYKGMSEFQDDGGLTKLDQNKASEYSTDVKSFLNNCKNRWSGFKGNHGPNASKAENAKYEQWQRMNNVINSTQYEVLADGSVKFKFKKDINVEDFKKAFGIESNGSLIPYFKNRHKADVASGKVHAIYTNGAQTESEQRAIYNTGGVGTEIKYTDGYSEKKQSYRFFLPGTYDSPDYRNMKLGPDDTHFQLSGEFFIDKH